jgi:hypothetical protein
MSLPSKKDLKRDLRRRSGHSDSDESLLQTSDSEVEMVARPSRKRHRTPSTNHFDEEDPYKANRAFLATPCLWRPPSCSTRKEL